MYTYLSTPRFTKLPRVLSLEEYENVTAKVELKYKVIFGLAFYCGLRSCEAAGAKLEDYNPHAGNLRVVSAKTKEDVERVVPVTPKFVKILNEYLDLFHPKMFILEKRPGKPFFDRNRTYWSGRLKIAGHEAGLYNWEKLKYHNLRHSFATLLVENGVEIAQISTLLGHSNIQHTQRYLHLAHVTKKGLVENVFEEQEEVIAKPNGDIKKIQELLIELNQRMGQIEDRLEHKQETKKVVVKHYVPNHSI